MVADESDDADVTMDEVVEAHVVEMSKAHSLLEVGLNCATFTAVFLRKRK